MPELLVTNPACSARGGAHWSAYSLQGAGRQRNADAFAASEDGRLFAVADGVGSLPASPVASLAAAEAAAAFPARVLLGGEDGPAILAAEVAAAVRHAAPAGVKGAATLAVVAIGGGEALVVSVGDSEVLAIQEEGDAVLLLPLDHLPAKPNVLLAWIDGATPFDFHVVRLPVLPHRLAMVTDGVTRTVTPAALATLVRKAAIADTARELVLLARANGSQDDLTALVIDPRAAAAASTMPESERAPIAGVPLAPAPQDVPSQRTRSRMGQMMIGLLQRGRIRRAKR